LASALLPVIREISRVAEACLCDHMRRLHGSEILESMHLLAPAREVVLTPGVALSLQHPRLAKPIFSVSPSHDIYCVHAPNQTK
jgi:hypothetical protein